MATTSVPCSITSDSRASARVHSAGALTSMIVSAAPGELIRLRVTNNTSTAGYVQIHDSATLPADTAVPLISVPLAASADKEIELVPVATGCVVAISTTNATLTISTNAATMFALFRS